VTGYWTERHNEFHNLYSHQILLKLSNGGAETGWACSIYGANKCIKMLVGKSEEKRPLRRTRHRWCKKKVKQSRYTPWRHMGGEEV
jgi:hypothetical protein